LEFPVVGEKNLIAEARVDELLNVSRPLFPWYLAEISNVVWLALGWFGCSVEHMVDPDGVSTFGETDEVMHILGVIAVPERYPGGTDALGFKDIGLRLTAAV